MKNKQILKVKNLKKHFGGVKAVNGCSFEIEEGKITALIGPNGAGKSTVFNLISSLIKADEGNIHFRGKEITKLPTHKIAEFGIARMFQQSKMFKNLSIKDNLLLSRNQEDLKFWKNFLGIVKDKKADEEKAEEYLKKIKLEHYWNKKTSDLSYGQQRLVELIRTITFPHKMIMLDEPVAGVTPPLRTLIAKMLDDMQEEGETILLIEHDMQFVMGIADKVIVMDEGKVIAQGPPEIIKKDKKVLEAYLGE